MSASNVPYHFERDHSLKQVKKPSDAPKNKHFAILIFHSSQHTEPGYDRGDSSYTVTDDFVDIYVTEDEANWKAALGDLYAEDMKRKDVLAYAVSHVPVIKPQVVVSIGTINGDVTF